jgi:hypothetical protein
VAGYTLGRGWIEMLRIDTANHFLGLRINVFTSILMFIVAVVVLIARRGVRREDPSSLIGRPPKLSPGEVDTAFADDPEADLPSGGDDDSGHHPDVAGEDPDIEKSVGQDSVTADDVAAEAAASAAPRDPRQ